MSTPPLRTLVVLETLASGRVLAYPLVAREHATTGTLEDVLVELDLFLSELFATQRPELIARYALPELEQATGTTIDELGLFHSFRLQIEDATLPERLRHAAPFEARGVVVPHHDGRWVLLPALEQTIYVAAGDDLKATVETEVQASLDAREAPLPIQLTWLPATKVSLRWMELAVQRSSEVPQGSARGLGQRLERAQRNRWAERVLAEVGRDRTALANTHPPVRGRDREIADLGALLEGPSPGGVLLVGEPGVGKSAIVEGWLKRLEDRDEAPRVIQTSGAQLIAGMSGMGQWQARVARVVEACDHLGAILYLDDLGDLFDARGESKVDLAAPIGRALEEGRLGLVGELDGHAFGELERTRESFFRNLQTLRVEPTSAATARAILEARRESLTDVMEVTTDAIDAMMSIGERFLPYRPHPGKVAELFDSVVAAARDPMSEVPKVTARAVHRIFGAASGVPEVLLREDRSLDAGELREHFETHVVGQSAAVEAVVHTLCVAKAGLQTGDKPLATFLFAGPTGVGKTELARALARFLYGSADRLLRFDMSEFADAYAAERLIRGTAGEEGELTRRIRQQPFAVVLLDEIEKAHPTLFDLLLQVTGEGRLTDARGRTAYFHDAILVMTSNIGATERRAPIGPRVTDAETDLARHYEGAVRRLFRPELVGRIDRIIPFAPLDHARVRTIADLQLARIATRRGLRGRSLALEVSPEAIDRLVTEGHDERYGARALRRELEERVVVPVAERIAASPEKVRSGRLRVDRAEAMTDADLEHRGLALRFEPSDASARDDGAALAALQKLRRDADQLVELPSVVEAREREAFLLAEMTLVVTDADRSNSDLGALQQEHHMLRERMGAIDERREAARHLEEMSFTASLLGEALPDVESERETLEHGARMAVLDLLLDRSPRHEITVRCEEYDGGRTLDIWLSTLLRSLDRRGWTATTHFFEDPRPSSVPWPSDRPCGPPCDPRSALELLDRPDRDPIRCLVRLSGPHVGTLVGVECGLHRFFGIPNASATSHHRVTLLAMRATLTDDDWAHSGLRPPQAPAPHVARRLGVVRYTDERPNRTLPPGYVDVPLEEYWSEANSDELALRTMILWDRHGSEPAAHFRGVLDLPDPEQNDDEDEA